MLLLSKSTTFAAAIVLIVMGEKPLISFVITDYNLPVELLREAIESILATDLKPEEREIILVDDGSDISPWEELAPFHDSVTYLVEPNAGPSVARNLGLDHAQGKFIQFVDGDDCLVRKGYNIIIDKLRHPDAFLGEVDIIMFKMAKVPRPKPTLANLLKLFWYMYTKEFLKKKNIRSAACGYVFRKDLLGEVRYLPGIYHEDEDFTPRLLLRCNCILYTSIRAYYYRQREGSRNHAFTPEETNKRFADLADTILRLRHESMTRGREAILRRANQLTMDYVYNASKAAADYEHFCQLLSRLFAHGLLPLPLRRYTTKYFCFALVTRFEIGRRCLFNILRK